MGGSESEFDSVSEHGRLPSLSLLVVSTIETIRARFGGGGGGGGERGAGGICMQYMCTYLAHCSPLAVGTKSNALGG